MKKNIILGIIIALLVIAIVLEGFFIWKKNNNKNKEEEKVQDEQVVETPSPEPTKRPTGLPEDEIIDGENLKILKKYSNPEDDELVYTYLTITVENKIRRGYEYEYTVPQINLKSKEIEEINNEILKKYKDIINEVNKRQEIDYMCEGLSYTYYENDKILSLVMTNPTEDSGYFICETRNIDMSTNKEMDNKELLEKINVDDIEIGDKILKTIDDAKLYSEDTSTDVSFKNFVRTQKEITVNRYKNISADEVEIYLNENENLCAYVEIHPLAGGEYNTLILDLEENIIIKR